MGTATIILEFINIIGILCLACVIQRVVFLKSQSHKQAITQAKFLGLGILGMAIMSFIIFHGYMWGIVGICLFATIPFIYTGVSSRKKHKWLGVFEAIPVLGFVDGIWSAIDILKTIFSTEFHRVVVESIVILVLLATIAIFKWKKPQFTNILVNDTNSRILSVGEEVIIWIVGIWLFAYDVIVKEYIEINATNMLSGYIAVMNYITAIVIVVFVMNSNYRNYFMRKNNQLQKTLVGALAFTIDSKDRYTSGHSKRVAYYSVELAKRMGKSEEEQRAIYNAGLLHDVGKIRVPESLINKPGKLTDEEFDQIRIHPVSGYHTLKDIYDDKQIALGAKYHHERYDGKGYPNNLSGENIPEIARIIGVADSYDAMASDRSYRKALPQEVVRSEIEKGKGKQFDPVIADIMLKMIDEDVNYEMRQKDVVYKDVLVIDDEPMNIKMVEFILKDEPVNVHSAKSGEEGLKILSEQSMDLVLLDIVMPNMDGFATFAKLREMTNVPVVFMTTDKNLDSIRKSAAMGVDDYVTKPFLPLVLKETVHGIVSRWDNEIDENF